MTTDGGPTDAAARCLNQIDKSGTSTARRIPNRAIRI